MIQDQEENAELRSSSWCGLFKKKESVKMAPFPQNKILQLTHSVEAEEFEYSESVRIGLRGDDSSYESAPLFQSILHHQRSRQSKRVRTLRTSHSPLLLQNIYTGVFSNITKIFTQYSKNE